MEKQNVTVDVSKRSSWTGKEKEVDTKIVDTIATTVTEMGTAVKFTHDYRLLQETVFVLVTGS